MSGVPSDTIAFSSEVETGSHQENASKQKRSGVGFGEG